MSSRREYVENRPTEKDKRETKKSDESSPSSVVTEKHRKDMKESSKPDKHYSPSSSSSTSSSSSKSTHSSTSHDKSSSSVKPTTHDPIQVIVSALDTAFIHTLSVTGRGIYRVTLPPWELNTNNLRRPNINIHDDEGSELNFGLEYKDYNPLSDAFVPLPKPCAIREENWPTNKLDGSFITFAVTERSTKYVVLTVKNLIFNYKVDYRIKMKFVKWTSQKIKDERGKDLDQPRRELEPHSKFATLREIYNHDRSHSYEGEFGAFVTLNIGQTQIEPWMRDAELSIDCRHDNSKANTNIFKCGRFPKQLCCYEEKSLFGKVIDNAKIMTDHTATPTTSVIGITSRTSDTQSITAIDNKEDNDGIEVSSILDRSIVSADLGSNVTKPTVSDSKILVTPAIGGISHIDSKFPANTKLSVDNSNIKTEKVLQPKLSAGATTTTTTCKLSRLYTFCVSRHKLPIESSGYWIEEKCAIQKVVRYSNSILLSFICSKKDISYTHFAPMRVAVELEDGSFLINYMRKEHFMRDHLLIPINHMTRDISIDYHKAIILNDGSIQRSWSIYNNIGKPIKIFLHGAYGRVHEKRYPPQIIDGSRSIWQFIFPSTHQRMTLKFDKCDKVNCSKHHGEGQYLGSDAETMNLTSRAASSLPNSSDSSHLSLHIPKPRGNVQETNVQETNEMSVDEVADNCNMPVHSGSTHIESKHDTKRDTKRKLGVVNDKLTPDPKDELEVSSSLIQNSESEAKCEAKHESKHESKHVKKQPGKRLSKELKRQSGNGNDNKQSSILVRFGSNLSNVITTIQQSTAGNERSFGRFVTYFLLFIICVLVLKM